MIIEAWHGAYVILTDILGFAMALAVLAVIGFAVAVVRKLVIR